MQIQTISVKELRTNFPKIRKALEKGVSFALIYRSKPLAEIKPIRSSAKGVKLLAKLAKTLEFKKSADSVSLVRAERD